MSDFNGKRLGFRDYIEREAWGRAYAAELAAGAPFGRPEDRADNAIIEMRIRQGIVLVETGMTGQLCCAVCLAPEHSEHAEGCSFVARERAVASANGL